MATVVARASSTRGAGPAQSGDAQVPRDHAPTTARTTTDSATAKRDDLSVIDDFLQSLARTVRQFHTYPATSPKCVDAIEECVRALSAVELDTLSCVVSPRELLVSGMAIGRGTLVEQELARRLYESRCQTLDIDRTATRRDLTCLCTELAARHDGRDALLADRLRNHGVTRIGVGSAYQPELLDVAATADACLVVERERLQQDALPTAGRVAHLYPADKGWVRVDPGVPLRQITLSGLAHLVEDPGALAQMISRLAGDSTDASLSPADALEQRCEDVARLYTSLDPAVARARFAKLAATVLTLESQQRRRLLSSTVLPALIDGRPEGDLLRDFPDVDLADALSLLLDVETAAPELLTSALDRLQLSPERRDVVAPLLEQRIHVRAADAAAARNNDEALRERTQQLIRVVNGGSFHDFSAFDLCIDAATEEAIERTNDAMHATNFADVQLGCVSHLIALNANPEIVERLLREATRLLGELERMESWPELTARLEELQSTSKTLRDSRADVSAAITAAIDAFYTPARFGRLIAMYDAGGDERITANRLITAAGAGLTTAVVRALQDAGGDKRVMRLVGDHATTFAAALARLLDELPVPQRIAAIRALAAAGRGFEPNIGRQLTHENEGVVREALRALTRVGSDEAAEFITRHLQRATVTAQSAAEEALWHFPPAITRQCVRSLLRNRQFVVSHPEVALRLLERVDRLEPAKLSDVLSPLASLRYRFWNPRLSRIGRKAAALRRP
jgi:HEAT repeat protein